MLTVYEIYKSIQGESTHAGRPCVFVRLAACDLRCSWCDTPYAFHEGRKRAIDDVVAEVEQYDCSLVEVTGGEPLLQEDVYPLMHALVARGKTVLLETGGHRSTERVPEPVITILDIKCPGSGMADRMYWPNVDRLRPQDEAKFVIKDRADYEWMRDVVRRENLPARCTVLVSPVFGEADIRHVAEWVLADKLPVRFQLQMHKYIWAPDMRGV